MKLLAIAYQQATPEQISKLPLISFETGGNVQQVVDKWFSVLGSSSLENALDEIKPLFDHSAYTLANPNRARSLLGSAIANSTAFHQADGAGYALAAQKILELDAINPQVAARLANPFVHWRKLVAQQGQLMKAQVENMLDDKEMSNDLNELLTTSLKD